MSVQLVRQGSLRRTIAQLSLALFAACTLALAASAALPAQAHAAKAVNKTLMTASSEVQTSTGSYEWTDAITTKTFKKYDITGDGKADTIKIKAGKHKVRIYVNGKLKGKVSESYAYDYTVTYLRSSKGRPLLYAKAVGDNYDGDYAVFQWKGGKLKRVASDSAVSYSYSYHTYFEKVWFKGTKLKVRYGLVTNTVAGLSATYTYTWKKGAFKRTGNTTSAISLTSADAYLGSGSWLTLAKDVTLYKKAGGKKKVVKAASGSKLKITAVCIKNKKLYFKAKTKAGKVGWFKGLTDAEAIAIGSSETNTLFKGVWAAG